MRVVKFAKYLPQFGWQPIVLTVKNGEFPYQDSQLAEDLPNDIKVYRTKAWDPFRLYKKLTGKSDSDAIPVGVLTHKKTNWKERLATFIRTNFFIPDARIGWLSYAKKEIKHLIEKENISAVFISSPPNSSQLLCLSLKKITDIPVISDFRDPWTDIRYYKFVKRMRISNWIDSYFERIVLEKIDFGTTVSTDLLKMFNQKLPQNLEEKFAVLPNGFDESDFEELKYEYADTFEIIHTGNLQEHQIPQAIIEVLSKFKSEKPEIYRQIRLKFIGKTSESLPKLINEFLIDDITSFLPFKPHSEIPKILKSAAILLMVVPKVENNLGIVTGKLFEYIGANRPVLVIGPKSGDAAAVLKNISYSGVFEYDDLIKIENFLLHNFELWSSKKYEFDVTPYQEQYSRKQLTQKLTQIFNQLASN